MSSRTAQRWAVAAAVVAISFSAVPRVANANEDRLREMNRRGMEAYDLLEYEEAKDIFSDAIVFAKRNGLGDSDVVARVHLNLGIVFFSGLQDEDSASIEFVNALEIDPNIQIPPAYRTSAMQEALDEIRADFGGETGGGACRGGTDLQHKLIEEAKAGEARQVRARLGSEVDARRVRVHYRSQGSSDYNAVDMREVKECTYQAEIPARDISGEYLYYYVGAERGGEVVASSGAAGTPNIIEIVGAQGGGTAEGTHGDDSENPLAAEGPTGSEPEGGATQPGGAEDSLFLVIAGGTGGGYVSGHTEVAKQEVGCCLAPSVFHVFPEIGFYLNSQTTLSAGFRMGFPLGANVGSGPATAAPGGLARLRYALSETGTGALLSFVIGGGVMRHTVPLSQPVQEGDTDTAASGPLLAGAGVGYSWPLGSVFQLITEVNAVVGIPVVNCIGNCGGAGRGVEPNFALQADANLGLLISF